MKQRFTRRFFLKGLGAAGVAAAAGPQILPSRAWGAANNRLNVALLACGNRTTQDLPSILRSGENIVAMCDVDARRFDKVKQTAAKVDSPTAASVEKAKTYEDYRQLLDKEKSVDAVLVAAGNRWHQPMSKAAILAGKHVFCEKPLSHSAAEAREIRELARKSKVVTQMGSQGGATATFRRSMEIMQAGLLGPIKEVHCWITRSFPPSAAIDRNEDPIPAGLNWDFWCGPSQLLPFKEYYLGGCLKWGRWMEFGDGHLADMGAHGLNLPWRALKLGTALNCSVSSAEPLKDSYPSANTFKWQFPAREGFAACDVYWHDGPNAGPTKEQREEFVATYGNKPRGDGCLFVGEKGMLLSNAWGVGGVMKLKGEQKFKGVLTHEAAANIPVVYPRAKNDNHMQEYLDACKGLTQTFQPFTSAAEVAELAMIGIVALRYGKPIEWDSAALKCKGAPETEVLVNRPVRKQWL